MMFERISGYNKIAIAVFAIALSNFVLVSVYLVHLYNQPYDGSDDSKLLDVANNSIVMMFHSLK